MLPVVLITPGEPAGIGPDIVLQMASQPIEARVVCIADVSTMRERASLLDLDIQINEVTDISAVQKHRPGKLDVLAVGLEQPVIPGQLNSANAPYVLDCLRLAVELISSKQAHALVTGPVHKGIINEAGIAFTGHTEFLAELTSGTPVMMLAADTLRVALVTTHLPLSQVSASITSEKLRQVITILHHDLVEDFDIAQPEILICGLNPHAGEDGHLGREEIEIIEPVIKELRQQGMKLTGPLPADTLFTPHHLQQADAVLAMYHDQGLPVLKHVGFGHAVNITLGLPIIRTSVDHGTALDLAGTGKANAGSLHTALDLAIQLSNNRLAN
ncbi:4-hydroxythreonine-4-phosphate dehydrogenase PdxA [Kaarinaea lacus]